MNGSLPPLPYNVFDAPLAEDGLELPPLLYSSLSSSVAAKLPRLQFDPVEEEDHAQGELQGRHEEVG